MTDEVCGRPVADLLRADVDELDGSGTTELAGHVRACERCGGLARSILTGYEALDDTLEAAVSVRTQSIVALGGARADAGVRHRLRWRLPTPPVWAAATATTASIAAALALMLPTPQGPRLGPVWQPPASMTSAPVVSAPRHNVAVIQTDDPDITVFWFYKE
ncbi:MAG: hypothetical protein OXH15_14030 [Gammaproteobacteria bacterium]|nr:hypothetical protein [Gammaproteobacteria bacterium]